MHNQRRLIPLEDDDEDPCFPLPEDELPLELEDELLPFVFFNTFPGYASPSAHGLKLSIAISIVILNEIESFI